MPPGAPPLPAGRFVELPGRGRTFVREVPGPPGAPCLVLLHGWTVNADLNWFAAYRSLSRRYRVVAIDHRGHGRGIRSRRPFRLTDCADDVAALCGELGIDRCTPVGYSMGGPVAMLTWRRHPELVDGLVLCATASHFRATTLERQLFTVLPVVAGATRLVPGPVRRAVAGRVLGRSTSDTDLGAWARAQIAQADTVAVAEAGVSLGRFDARPWLAEVDVPTAVVRTTRDQAVPPARQLALARGIHRAELIDVAVDHAGCVTGAHRFVPALLKACASATHRESRHPVR